MKLSQIQPKSSTSLKLSQVAPQNSTPATDEQPGFLHSLASGIIKTPARLATNVVQAAEVATGNKKTTPFSGKFLGDVQPVGNTGKGFVSDVKDSVGSGAELGSYLIGGGEAKAGLEALKSGEVLAKPTLKAIFNASGRAVAPAFAVNSAGTSLQDTNKGVGRNIVDTGLGYLEGYGLGGLFGLGAKGLEKTGLPEKVIGAIPERVKNAATNAGNKTKDHISNLVEMTRDVLGTGIKEVGGKKVPTGAGMSAADKTEQSLFGGSQALPSENEIRRATAVSPYITPGASSVRAESELNKAGEDFANNTMKPFLEKNATPVNFKEVHDYMYNTPKPSNISRDPVSDKAFDNTVDTAVELITKKSRSGGRDIYNGFDINEARKELDTLAREEEGVFDVGSPRNKGAKAAIDAVRTQINQLNEDAIKYGDISAVNKARQAFNDFKTRGVRTEGTSDQQLLDELLSQNGVKTTPEKEKAAEEFRRYLQHQKDILEARNNLRVKNTQKLDSSGKGPSKIKELLENNPITSKIIQNPGTSLGTVGGALATLYALGKK